jgi:DNA-binding transcriptional regulator GbsR (MarR family)
MRDQPSPLSFQDQIFIEEFSVHATQGGLPLSAARIYGYLMVCEPAHQTADDIKRALNISTGGISNAVHILTAVGIISRVTLPGKRSFFYTIEPRNFYQVLQHRIDSYEKIAAMANKHLALHANNSRLAAMQGLYSRAAETLSSLANRPDN